ncbi:MAG: NUDIX hydrolase [Pseudomonadota bacterium]
MTQPTLAALAVVPRDGRVILVRRRAPPDAGLWGFPGGRVEWGETVADAACRELMEETSVSARPDRLLTGLDVVVRDDAGRVAFHYYLAAVRCTWLAGTPRAGDDAVETAWVDHAAVLAGHLPMSRDVDSVLCLALA